MKRGTLRSNEGKGRRLSAEIVTQLNSVADCGLIQEKLWGLGAIVFFLYAFNLDEILENHSKL